MTFFSLSILVLSLYSTLYFCDVSALKCYNCPIQNTVNDCNTTTTCDGPEMGCMLRRTTNGQNKVVYTSGCSDIKECERNVHFLPLLYEIIIRKRDAYYKTRYGDHLCIMSCCTKDFCNNGCHESTG